MARFEDAQAALIRRKKQAEGVSFTVRVKNTNYTLTGWVGRTVFASNNEFGARVEIGERDILFDVADLTTAGLGEPDIGWRFLKAGESVTFECVPPETGEPAWRYSDPQRLAVRIHTKRVK